MSSQVSINFSDENVALLSSLTDGLGDFLIHSNFGVYVDHLSQIRLYAEKKDEDAFKNNVTSATLFGGSGALWEIWIENLEKRKEFEKRFCGFVDHLLKMGIKNPRIQQIRKGFMLQ